jgi:hypothetical protein
MLRLLLGLALASASASPAAADAVPLQLGRTVRAELADAPDRPSRLEGRLMALSGESLTLRSDDRVFEVPWNDVRRIQRRHKERRASILHGAALGLLAGAIVGGPVAAISNNASSCSYVCASDGETAIAGAVFYGVLGLTAGGVVGAVRPAQWDEAIPRPKAEASVGLMPVRRGLGVQMRLRF